MTRCLTSSCKWRPPGECVYYSGDNISGYNINDGDNLNVVVQKITSYIAGGGSSGETPNIPQDTNSIDMSVFGVNGRTISADVRRDGQANNKLTIGTSGLYVAPASFSATFNPETGQLSFTVDGTTQEMTLTGGISSVFGRTGVITAQAGDYNWNQLGNIPNTLAGLGVTDPVVLTSGSYADPTWITSLAKAKVGLGNVVNIDTTNASNISSGTLPSARIGADIARVNNLVLTGIPEAPTPLTSVDNNQIATTAFVHDLIAAISSGVLSFNGRSGTVLPVSGDYTWAQINKTTSSLADITTRSAADLSSGTLADARLSSNIPRLDVSNTFTGVITLSNLAGTGTRVALASPTGVLSAGTLTSADVGLGNVPNLDFSNPANITQDATHRFVTDTEKTTWNGKQDALGFTPVPNTRSINGIPLSSNITLTSTEIGLGNVPNVDATNATNISTGSLSDARLSANIPLLNAASNNFTGRLHALLTTEQLRLSYDASNFLTATVDSAGSTTFNVTASSGTPTFTFSDIVYFPSGLRSNVNSDNANFSVPSGTAMGSTAHSSMQMAGATGTVRSRIMERGNTGQVMSVGDSYIGHIIGTQTITEAASGTHQFIGALGIKAVSATAGTAATDYAATVYIEGPITGITPASGNYSLWVDAGNIRLDSLGGVGSRMVVADADGVLSTQAIPGGTFAVETAMLSSDVTSSGSAATWSNITGLSFSVVAGESYRFEAYIIFSVDATSTGTTWALTGPASPTILNYHVFHGSGTGFNTTWTNENLVTYDDGIPSNTSPATTGNSARITGFIRPSSSGTVTLRMRAETASGATAKIGSYLVYQRLA